MGCGLGGAWDCFCAGLEGGRVEEGASGGPSAPDLEQTARRRLPAKRGGGPEPGPGGSGGGLGTGWTPPPGREAGPPPKMLASDFPRAGCGVGRPCPHRLGIQAVDEPGSDLGSDTREGLTLSRFC